MEKTNNSTNEIVPAPTSSPVPAYDIVRRLPNWALVPSMVVLFGLLLTDLVVIDPIPLVDEGAMLLMFMHGLRVLGERRKEARARASQPPEATIVGDAMPEGAADLS